MTSALLVANSYVRSLRSYLLLVPLLLEAMPLLLVSGPKKVMETDQKEPVVLFGWGI